MESNLKFNKEIWKVGTSRIRFLSLHLSMMIDIYLEASQVS